MLWLYLLWITHLSKLGKWSLTPDQDVQITDCTQVLETLKPVCKSTFTRKDQLAAKKKTPVNKNRNKRTVVVHPKTKPAAAKKKKVVTTKSPGSPNPDSGLGETIISHPSTEDTIQPSSPASSDEFVTSTPKFLMMILENLYPRYLRHTTNTWVGSRQKSPIF